MSNLHRAILHEDGKIKIAIRFIVPRYFYHVDLQPCYNISIHCFCFTFHHLVDLHPILGAAEVVISWAGRPSRLLLLLFAKIGKLALSLFRSFVSSPVISRCGEIRN